MKRMGSDPLLFATVLFINTYTRSIFSSPQDHYFEEFNNATLQDSVESSPKTFVFKSLYSRCISFGCKLNLFEIIEDDQKIICQQVGCAFLFSSEH